MDKQEMIDKIYKTIWWQKEILYRCNRVREAWDMGTMTEDDFEKVEENIMIWDILDWIIKKEKSFFENNYPIEQICSLLEGNWKDESIIWKKLREPIENQSEECIEYVYNIIKDNE